MENTGSEAPFLLLFWNLSNMDMGWGGGTFTFLGCFSAVSNVDMGVGAFTCWAVFCST